MQKLKCKTELKRAPFWQSHLCCPGPPTLKHSIIETMIHQNVIIIKNLDVSKSAIVNMMITEWAVDGQHKASLNSPGCWFLAFMKITICTCGTDFCSFRSEENLTKLKSLITWWGIIVATTCYKNKYLNETQTCISRTFYTM